jgi:hypothetical protein
VQGCTGDPTPIAVPTGTQIPMKPECEQQQHGNAIESIVKRAGEWLRDIMH